MEKLLFPLLALIMASSPARAELPILDDDKKWLGSFAGFETRDLRFQFSAKGNGVIHPLFRDKQAYPYVRIPIEISLVETLADGSTKTHAVRPESLESTDKPTSRLKRTTVQGDFEGGGSFEVTLENKRGEVLLGGKLTDPGSFDPRKVRFCITAEILNFYGKKKLELANDPKAFAALAGESTLTVTTKDRQRTKLDFTENLPAAFGREASVRAATVELAAVGPREFAFSADGASGLRLAPRRNGPLYLGFFVSWSPDATAKTSDNAGFAIRVK